jgi:solute carrier family 13 (sodium-dependent dicarboxylate transporter), member 2/3/5
MDWPAARDIPWHVLLLFGGGLSLAAAMDASGLAAWIGSGLTGVGDVPDFLFVVLLVTTVVVLTELTSNTATVAALLPVMAAVATSVGLDLVAVSAAVAMAASCAFMLPVATPPNALVFASGYVRVVDMARAGIVMNLISIVLVSAAATLLAPLLAPIAVGD